MEANFETPPVFNSFSKKCSTTILTFTWSARAKDEMFQMGLSRNVREKTIDCNFKWGKHGKTMALNHWIFQDLSFVSHDLRPIPRCQLTGTPSTKPAWRTTSKSCVLRPVAQTFLVGCRAPEVATLTSRKGLGAKECKQKGPNPESHLSSLLQTYSYSPEAINLGPVGCSTATGLM